MNRIICLIASLFIAQAFCQRYHLEEFIRDRMAATTGVLPDNPSLNASVEVDYYLTHVVDYDYNQQLLETSGWLSMIWEDERLTWRPEMHGNIQMVSLPCEHFIKPDIKLYNGVKEGMVIDKDTNCIIYNTGSIFYVPIVSIKSFCSSDGPDDGTFTCKIKLGSWTNTCDNLSLKKKESYIDFSDFDGGWRWQLNDSRSSLEVKQYECCPEPYCDIMIELDLIDNSKKSNTWL